VWIVNVGHFKSYAFPMEFFLHLAWDTDRWTYDSLHHYTELWAGREFGNEVAAETAAVVAAVSRYNGRRKPELLAPDIYSLVHFGEAERVVADWRARVAEARAIRERLPEARRDAFDQLVLIPALAAAQVNELYVAAGRNILYAEQGRAATNAMADRVEELFAADQALRSHFDRNVGGGRWRHFMDQPHIGYTSWRGPPEDTLDALPLRRIELPAGAALGVAAQGSRRACPCPGDEAQRLPEFDALHRQRQFVDVFNRGRDPFDFEVTRSHPWIETGRSAGRVETQARVWVTIDWARARWPRSSSRVSQACRGRPCSAARCAIGSRSRRCRCRGRPCGSRTLRACWPTRTRSSSPAVSTVRTCCTTGYSSTALCARRRTYITTPAT
jgi:hypothetical protein